MLLSVPAILVRGLCERQSDTASVANAATQTLRHLEPIFILRCGPLGTMTYSYRNATTGSTDDALRAGMKHDKPEVATSSRITPRRIGTLSELP